MTWMESIEYAVAYIEKHITDNIKPEEIAKAVNISYFYFQKGFTMLCGYTIGEYIRNRRLALAGTDLATGSEKVIDIALKYGYSSPDSFTKAFTRFHGVTPIQVRNQGAMLKSFAPLRIKISLEGGYLMDYKIEKKEAFYVLANARTFDYENVQEEVPKFWQEHFSTGKGQFICGSMGINVAEINGDTFEYLIADECDTNIDVPEGFEVRMIPKLTWAIFPCKGSMPESMQKTNTTIFSEWLPGNKEFEFAAGYCIEYYDDPTKYEKGIMDEEYYSELWIPVKRVDK